MNIRLLKWPWYTLYLQKNAMSFGGHVAAMISSLRNNRALLSRRSLKERSRDAFSHLGDKARQAQKLHHRKATKDEIEYTRREIEKEKKNQGQRNLIFYSLIVFLSIAFFYGAFWFMGIKLNGF